jgi:putative Mg2+ transporter-C (MgtC) family protein
VNSKNRQENAVPSDIDLTVRIVLAVLLGAVIGLERELTGQSAGLRTHITISMGAALFAIGSAYSFSEFIQPRADTNYQVDVTRIASNIVTGVGFLGGGAIIKHGASVSGLTTAASIWVTAAVGLAVGLGSFFPAVVTTGLLVFVLTALRRPRRWLSRRAATKGSVVVQLRPDADPGEIVNAMFGLTGVTVKSVSVRADDPQNKTVSAELKGTQLHARLAELAEREDVADLDLGS